MTRQTWLALVLGAAVGSVATTVTNRQDNRVYELRTYTTNDGKLPNLHARFRDHTMQLFEKHGMTNVGYWTPVDQPNTLVYLLAHDSRDAADQSWRAFGADPEWQEVARASQVDGRILVRGGVVRQFLTPTDYSPVR